MLHFFPVDWRAARKKVDTEHWAAAGLEAVRKDYALWQPLCRIPSPQEQSAWTHHFYCDDDGTRLIFDPQEPQRHVCPKCERIYSGEPWDGAWRTQMHNAVAAQAERAALLIRLGQEAEAEQAAGDLLHTLTSYAQTYSAYSLHGANAGKGRVMPQCLDEAIWLIGLFRALNWSGLKLEAQAQTLVRRFAQQAIEVLRPQVSCIHNIHCWMLGAIAHAATWLGDEALLRWCRDSDFGAQNQILQGFREDGLWYEVNPGYHYYTITGLLAYVEAFGEGALDVRATERLVLAINNPPKLAYDDGLLPAYADGWPVRTLNEFAWLAEMAAGLLGGQQIDLAPYYKNQAPRAFRLCFEATGRELQSAPAIGRHSSAALVYGPSQLPAAKAGAVEEGVLWTDSGIAVIRNACVRLGIRFGRDGGWHDHRDKLCVDADVLLEGGQRWRSLDLGTSGYGADFTQWLRSWLAHNVITTGAAPQEPHSGRLVAYSADRVSAESVYGGKTLRRTLQLQENGWDDAYHLTVATEESGQPEIIWAFHGDGLFEAPVSRYWHEASGAENGAEALPEGIRMHLRWLRNLRRLEVDAGTLRGQWRPEAAGAGQGVSLAVSVPEGFSAYAAQADGNPLGGEMGFVFLCGHGRQAQFDARFRIGEID